jgi:hypothetical protein
MTVMEHALQYDTTLEHLHTLYFLCIDINVTATIKVECVIQSYLRCL